MPKAEKTIRKIIEDIKEAGFDNEITKKELIIIISRYTTNPYPYINRLWGLGYIKELNSSVFKILKL